ncbi:MAG: hypothetical protein AAB401_15000, partial [Acidobacteriota bacterium]
WAVTSGGVATALALADAFAGFAVELSTTESLLHAISNATAIAKTAVSSNFVKDDFVCDLINFLSR